MKRIILIFAIVFMCFMTPKVYAGTAYVDSINIDAKIKDDGSMLVQETIVWDIVDDLNGVYRDILIENTSNKLNSASDIAVHKVVVNDQVFDWEHTRLLNGANGKYNVNIIDGGKQIKIFRPSSDEYMTTCITYTLKDVVVKYNDVAELYWNFIGSGWEYGIDNVKINVTLPNESQLLKVFGHGPLFGYSSITGKDSATIEVAGLRGREIVDMRLLFDASLVNTTKIVEENVLKSILISEARLAEHANVERRKAERTLYYSIVFVCIAIAIPIALYVFVAVKTKKASFKGKYYRELPEDYGPAVMSKLLNPTIGNISSNDMLATLLDLVTRKYVEIQPIIKEGKKKPTDYILKLIQTDLSELNESEKYFVEKLIFANACEITLKELSRKNASSIRAQNKAHQDYIRWSEIITELAKEKDLIRKEKIKISQYILMCLPCILITIVVAIYGGIKNYEDIIAMGVFGTVLGIFEVIGVILGIHELNVRTSKGVEHKAMWKAFKKFLLDFSKLDEHEYKSIAIWEHYLVYATSLGIAKKVIKELRIVFPTEFANENDMFSTYTTIGLLSDTDSLSSFSSSFTSAATTAFSTPSSSDGSGGGFSGIAGGGRWRRRWRWILALNNM